MVMTPAKETSSPKNSFGPFQILSGRVLSVSGTLVQETCKLLEEIPNNTPGM